MEHLLLSITACVSIISICIADPLVFPALAIPGLNQGTVRRQDEYIWVKQPCAYLEAENVTTPYRTWQSDGHINYRYQSCGKNCTVPPPIGIRSAVPLGGISTGSVELRADGSLHEWTIINQSPSSAPKIQVFDEAFFAVRTSTITADHKLKFIPFKNLQTKKFANIFWNKLLHRSNADQAFVLRTHPPSDLPGVEALTYRGLHPVSQITVVDSRLPLTNVKLSAFSTYFPHDMNSSAAPAISFLFTATNPSASETYETSFMFNLPFGIEKNQGRDFVFTPTKHELYDFVTKGDSAVECFRLCNDWEDCRSWTFDDTDKSCRVWPSINLNGYDPTKSGGLKGSWSVSRSGNLNCITLDRPGELPPSGNISLCTNVTNVSFGVDDEISELWNTFSKNGEFNFTGTDAKNVHGAISMKVTLAPGQTVQIPMTMAWYYPNRDFGETIYGNWYKNLFTSSLDVAQEILNGKQINLANQVSAISKLHQVFLGNNTKEGASSIPLWLSDVLLNSLGHIRSAMWFADGKWRQWEAYDCSNIDSVHNDGERHIPYIMFFPESIKNKMMAWGKSQLADGMIPEQLQSNCFTNHFGNIIDVPSGRVMSDGSSMFMVYLLELYKWGNEQALVKELWPYAKRAAQWHMDVTKKYGTMYHIQNTYDVLGLQGYDFCTFNSAFHLLAMKASEALAKIIGDEEFAARSREVYNIGVEALDRYLWNETTGYYNSYLRHIGETTRTGAIMTDSFYAQVLSHSVGLGDLVDRTKLSKHLAAELDYNDSPYGMLGQTGRYPYPGPPSDNSVWNMGNPNWASTQIRLGFDVDEALGVAKKTLDRYRTIINDLWNVAGINGGLGYGAEGQPYLTGHYGFYMSSWHIILALSGQQADLPNGVLTYDPKAASPFNYPVMLPGVLGTVTSTISGSSVTYRVSLLFGELNLNELKVGQSKHPGPVNIKAGQFVEWRA